MLGLGKQSDTVMVLGYLFKTVTTLSLIEFRTHLRLQEARWLIVSKAADAASARFQVRYESPSQFRRDYAWVFGISLVKHAPSLGEEQGSLTAAT